jgi:hypothetical protein
MSIYFISDFGHFENTNILYQQNKSHMLYFNKLLNNHLIKNNEQIILQLDEQNENIVNENESMVNETMVNESMVNEQTIPQLDEQNENIVNENESMVNESIVNENKSKVKEEDIYKLKLLSLSNNIISNFELSKDICLIGGDNFYPYGLNLDNCDMFARLYDNYFGKLKDRSYAVLGNHDYIGDINLQINNDKLFNMPEKYYHLEYNNISIFMIDTQLLDPIQCSSYIEVANSINNTKNMNMQDSIRLINELRTKMIIWLDNKLSNCNNKFKIVCGHFPILTHGVYNYRLKYNIVMAYLLPLFVKHNVNIYISGHDHNTQIQKFNNNDILNMLNQLNIGDYIWEIINIIYPNFKTEIENKCDYILHNIVSGSCIDKYKYNDSIYSMFSDLIIYQNYTYNLYVKIDTDYIDENKIIIEFIHNNNLTCHQENPNIQYIEFSYTLIF